MKKAELFEERMEKDINEVEQKRNAKGTIKEGKKRQRMNLSVS